jgi:hypothetical protein
VKSLNVFLKYIFEFLSDFVEAHSLGIGQKKIKCITDEKERARKLDR